VSSSDPPRIRRAGSARRPVPDRVGPGEESVWDYPRPPRLEPERREVRVELAGQVIARSRRALRVCETAGPPTIYVPPEDVRMELLEPSAQGSFCEWKGAARYFSVRVGERLARDAAWSYPEPRPPYEALRDRLAFYPGRVDACFLADERVEPQPGRFYGGWITREIRGPFKGEPGSEGW
jgi:uncharacterized protein (DUF427 family)